MCKIRRLLLTAMLSVISVVTLCLGVAFSMPAKTVSAETLSTANWTLAREADGAFRIQNGTAYWSTYTNSYRCGTDSLGHWDNLMQIFDSYFKV